jgi:hypothetical protein
MAVPWKWCTPWYGAAKGLAVRNQVFCAVEAIVPCKTGLKEQVET